MICYRWRFDETFDPCDGVPGGRDLTPEEYAAGCERVGARVMAEHWKYDEGGAAEAPAGDDTDTGDMTDG